MKYNKELLDKFLNEKYVVAVRTEQEWIDFMELLESETECEWLNGIQMTKNNRWNDEKISSCIATYFLGSKSIVYGYERYFIKKGKKIIEYQDLIKQDLRDLLQVGYKVVISMGNASVIEDEEHLNYFKSNRTNELKYNNNTPANDINAIYRPKYNGIKSIGKPEWELVWKREEKLFTLSLPNNCFGRKYLGVNLEKPTKYGFYKLSSNSKQAKSLSRQFTQKEIDSLPNQELIKTLIKREVKQ